MRFIDSHIHLSQYPSTDQLLSFARATGTLFLAASTCKNDSMITLKFAAENAGCVVPFIGVHPSETVDEGGLDWLDAASASAKGIGEVGLDPKYSEVSAGGGQMARFQAQLSVAERRRIPVQIHSRGAESEVIAVLQSFNLAGVLLHWFEGEEHVREAADRGYFVSFGPAILYSKKLRRIATSYPDDLVVTESDGPVAFSALGGVGGAWTVPSVVFELAVLKRQTFAGMAERVLENALSYVRVGEKG